MNHVVLIIGHRWPEPNSSAAGTRMTQLIYLFIEGGYDIVFGCVSHETENSLSSKITNVTWINLELNSSSFDDQVVQYYPKIVLFDRFITEEQFGWRVRQCCPDALTILDTEDLHFLRKGRGEAIIQGRPYDDSFLYSDIAKREIASIYRCDFSLIISKYEIALLTSKFSIPKNLLFYLPFLYDKRNNKSIKLPYESRVGFVTIGNFLHKPNLDSVKYLKTEIWPLIRSLLPEASLSVYGAYPPNHINQLTDTDQGFFIKGFVDDADIWIGRSRVLLAPLRYGAGLKGKVFKAMKNGTPCMMTRIAAEGFYDQCDIFDFIKDDPIDFAQGAVRIYTEKERWTQTRDMATSVLENEFSIERFKSSFLSYVADHLSHLVQNRNDNFIGQMMHYHTMQSTKYMSKWIEEKNK